MVSLPALYLVTGTLSMAERSYPTSEVRGKSQEDPMPEGWRPRGVTPHPRSGQELRVPGCDSAGTAQRSYPVSEVWGGGLEEPPMSKEWWLRRCRRDRGAIPR